MRRSILVVSFIFAVSPAGCKRDKEPDRGSAPPPPPVVSSLPGACASGGGKVRDPASESYFPRLAGDYCVDPNGEAKTFGEGAQADLDAVCDLFDGECEVYKNFGLKRVVTVQYVDGKGSPGMVVVTLSRFASPEAAFAFYTKRVVADGDPLEVAPKPLDAGAAAAIGSGMAYVWRGEMVAELRYVHELESPTELRASSAKILPIVARELGQKLPGERGPLEAVQRLPEAHRIASGVVYEYRDLLGVSGAGRGAVGYYQDGPRRYRVFTSLSSDQDSAKDVHETLAKISGARRVKDSPIDALLLELRDGEGEPKQEWIVGRSGTLVVGIGDEPYALGEGGDASPRLLPRSEKQELLRTVLSGKETSAAGSDAGAAPSAPAPAPSH